jgi:hypothetical protein
MPRLLIKQEEYLILGIKNVFMPSEKKSINSEYSNHILNTRHTCRRITDTMDAIRTGRKGRHLNTLEKYNIHKIIGKTCT